MISDGTPARRQLINKDNLSRWLTTPRATHAVNAVAHAPPLFRRSRGPDFFCCAVPQSRTYERSLILFALRRIMVL